MKDQPLERPYDIEEALRRLGARISSPEFADHVRRIVECGHDLRYNIKIKREMNDTFSVSMENIVETFNKRLSRHYNLQ